MTQGKIVPLVKRVDDIKLALAGKNADNDHPYSWSAILNGYEESLLADCPNAIIRKYLAAQPKQNFGIEGVRITHVYCDDIDDARRVARVSRIPNVVTSPEELIGAVDAVLIPTDVGHEHLVRARPFVEAGIPVFIDKPLTDREDHLQQFVSWFDEGRPIMSSSCMRHAKEFQQCRERMEEIGALRFVTSTTCRSWERYGIHAMEAIYPFLPPGGWVDVTCGGSEGSTIAHVRHASGTRAVIAAIDDMDGAFGCVSLYGTKGALHARFGDSFFAFKAQLATFVDYLRQGIRPYPFTETVELMKIIIAGARSRKESGRTVSLAEISSTNPS